jgi:GH43 family beta-xylosidase
MLYTGDDVAGGTDNRWAIDGTVLDLNGQLHFLWSGWADERDVQHLYIAKMSDPRTIGSNRVQLCPNDCHPWELVTRRGRHQERGLHEGPQVLTRHGRLFLVYSCSGSWQPSYKLGMLYMDAGADPMNPASWRKYNRPVFDSTPEVFGVGHCCFTTSPDGTEEWMLYHSKRFRTDCWDRVVRAQRFTWDASGFPNFGTPVPSNARLPLPSGDPTTSTVALPEAA